MPKELDRCLIIVGGLHEMTTPRRPEPTYVGISDHRWIDDVEGASYWELALEGVSLTFFMLEPNTRFPTHTHHNEQITLVLEGTLAFDTPTGRYEVGPQEVIAIPSNKEHTVYALGEPVAAVDAWSPPPQHLGPPASDRLASPFPSPVDEAEARATNGSGEDLIKLSFDAAAEWYATDFADELTEKPFDRAVLDRFCGLLGPQAAIVDVGCGPGHIAGYLVEAGLTVTGVDVSERMIEMARSLNPDIAFCTADMRHLPHQSQSIDGIVAFYSIIYFDGPETEAILTELHRVLTPGGLLLAAVHVGEGVERISEYHGIDVNIAIVLRPLADFIEAATTAGFELIFAETRTPYPQEHQTERGYLILRARPAR